VLQSLRIRVAIAIAGVCIALVAALGGRLYYASEEMEGALVEQMLAEQLRFLVQHHAGAPDRLPAANANVQYYIARNAADRARLPAFARSLAPGMHEVVVAKGEEERHVAVRDEGETRFIVVYDIRPYEEKERAFRSLIWISLVGVALASLPIGYLVAGRLTSQLRNLSDRVAALPPDAPPANFAEPNQVTEVSTVARALDDYQRRMLELLRREKEFTANASHELRNPLTTILTSCEILAREQNLPAKVQERIDFIRQAVEQMAAQVQALLVLARSESDPKAAAPETLDLGECVEDATRPLLPALTAKGLELRVDVPQAATIRANRQALSLVLSNLLTNAIRYTRSGYVSVCCGEGRLTVADSGEGIAPAHLERIFGRFYRAEDAGVQRSTEVNFSADERLGIGLDIVRRVCERAGWGVEATSTFGKGSSFSIVFEPAAAQPIRIAR
jgi:signal transduction histidine kinase